MNAPLHSLSHRQTITFTAAGLLLLCLWPTHARADGANNTSTGTGALPTTTTGSNNTADGFDALHANTTASNNTAVGFDALLSNTGGSHNTATGAGALQNNTNGHENTAGGYDALHFNTIGSHNTALGHTSLGHNTFGAENTASGYQALFNNTVGIDNTASGSGALSSNTTGSYNTANGYDALRVNTAIYNTATGADAMYQTTTGAQNTVIGAFALYANTAGEGNAAFGLDALFSNSTAGLNTAIGRYAMYSNSTGERNIAVGESAGYDLTTGSDNIDIGHPGKEAENATIRIGQKGVQTQCFIAGISGTVYTNGTAVYIDSNGHLGTVLSSARFKDGIRDMDAASDALLALRPVAFRYKPELDPTGAAQFGLVAEEVEKVAPSLVVHDDDGKPYSVRYEQVNAMLLNEFLKEHAAVQAQASAISRLEAAHTEQTRTLAEAMDQLKQLTADLRKVNAQTRAPVSGGTASPFTGGVE